MRARALTPASALRLTLRDKPPNLGTAAIKLYLGLTSSDHHTRWQPHSPRDPRTASLGYVWASQQPRPPRLRVPYLWLLELKSWFSTPQKSARTTNGISLCRGRHPLKLHTCKRKSLPPTPKLLLLPHKRARISPRAPRDPADFGSPPPTAPTCPFPLWRNCISTCLRVCWPRHAA